MALFSVVLVASDNSANASTINLNPDYVQSIAAANAGEIVDFSTALTAITYIVFEQNERRTRRLLTATATATVVAAYAAAQANVLGSGQSGDAVLVAGTVAVTIPGLTTASKAVLTRHIANTTTLTTGGYQYAVTANTLTITATVAAGTINVADVSTITYAIVG